MNVRERKGNSALLRTSVTRITEANAEYILRKEGAVEGKTL